MRPQVRIADLFFKLCYWFSMDACMAGWNFRIQGQVDWLTHGSQTLKTILVHCSQVIPLEVAWLQVHCNHWLRRCCLVWGSQMNARQFDVWSCWREYFNLLKFQQAEMLTVSSTYENQFSWNTTVRLPRRLDWLYPMDEWLPQGREISWRWKALAELQTISIWGLMMARCCRMLQSPLALTPLFSFQG